MLILFVLIVAYAIQGAISQGWSDGRAAAATGYRRATATGSAAVKRARASKSRGARVAGGTAAGLGAVGRGAWSVTSGTGRALWSGGREGARRGRERGVRRAARRRVEARRRVRDRVVDPMGQPRWRHWVTGRCPSCEHTPAEAATEIPGCGCTAVDWGCPCARSVHRPEPEPEPEPDGDPVDLTKPTPQPIGGDGAAASTDPTDPTPTIPPDPAPITGDPAMSAPTMDEVTTYSSARRAMQSFVARATTFLDVADAAEAEAAGVEGQAAALEAQAEQMAAGLGGNEFDAATLGEVHGMLEQASMLRAAAARLRAAAGEVRGAADALSGASATALSGMTARHSTLDEAHRSAPVRAARREGYAGE